MPGDSTGGVDVLTVSSTISIWLLINETTEALPGHLRGLVGRFERSCGSLKIAGDKPFSQQLVRGAPMSNLYIFHLARN